MRPLIINHFHISGNYIAGDFIEIHDNPSASFYQGQHVPFCTTSTATVEDVVPVDTSFFGTDRYTAEVCEKNLREAIDQASGKADACRRIMMADACGYIHIRATHYLIRALPYYEFRVVVQILHRLRINYLSWKRLSIVN